MENSEANGYSDDEIAGHGRLALIPHQGHPALEQ